jgi:hypothetical protein
MSFEIRPQNSKSLAEVVALKLCRNASSCLAIPLSKEVE